MAKGRRGLDAYLRLLAERLRNGGSAENWSATRRAVALHIEEYLSGDALRFDREIATAILVALQQAESKEVPLLFAPTPRKKGEGSNTAAVASCIAAAGSYIRFCLKHKDEPEVDPAPRKTVAEAFGVAPRTASLWKAQGRDVAPRPDETVAECFAMVRAVMLGSAAQYARFGGSGHKAVAKRAKGAAA